MHRSHPALIVLLAVILPLPLALAQEARPLPGGTLQVIGTDEVAAGACPLEHTAVEADIAGFVGRVTVRQTFHNPTDQKIEAVYVFPLPSDAAVDDMVMQVGDRQIVGQIKERAEARQIYEDAKAAGHVASLLDQERPNIFTQSVANIEPGVKVIIEISYVETLKYEDGAFTWVFPMVVAPRYVPGSGSAPSPMTEGAPTPQVPDGDKITPPVTPKGTRAGHDISLAVRIDAGLPIRNVASKLHEITIEPGSRADNTALITLKQQNEIPNRDFVLQYWPDCDTIGDAYVVHEDERGRFFTLVLQPPQRIIPDQLVPRELIFVLDTSGSMGGFPIEKAKEVMTKLIGTMRRADTFNLITFAGRTSILWDNPRPATDENIDLAQKFIAQGGSGGTEMMSAINAALTRSSTTPENAGSIRVVCFLTDGHVGNDMAIIDAVKHNAKTTRVFSFGIGNSVNRFLLDGMARAGRGEVEYVLLESQGDAAVERFHERVLAPVLTDIEIDWGDLPVADVYPTQIPDLFSAKPIMVHGRLVGEPEGTITLRGYTGDGRYEDQIRVTWPDELSNHPALPSLWARTKVEHLMTQDYAAEQTQQFPDELKQQVLALGLEFRLMTQFTGFVAVEEMTVTVGGEPTTITVPVEMPDGMSYEGVFGPKGEVAYGLLGNIPAVRGLAAAPRLGGAVTARRGAGGARSKSNLVVGTGGAGVLRERATKTDKGTWDVTQGLGEPSTQPALTDEQIANLKLAEPLRNLAQTTQEKGQDGNLTIGKLKVINYRVDVMILLRDASDEVRGALKKLGFEQTNESKSVSLLVGTIDVRKLVELATLDAVIRVSPVTGP